jgi:hypothetical protein
LTIQAVKEWKLAWRFRRFLGLRWRGFRGPLGSLRESSPTGIGGLVDRVGETFGFLTFCLPVYSLPPVPPPSMPFAFGCHPGTAAVIRPIVHDRAAFGLWFFPHLPMVTAFRSYPKNASC